MNNEFLWTEKYRPIKIDDCILPERFKTIFRSYVDNKTIPNLMLAGKPGVGKTTVAKALCEEIGIDYMFINSSNERGIDTLRNKITNYASTVSLSGGQKVIILDEADNITLDAQAALRGAIEQFSSNCTFILTCNFQSKLMDAIHSRTAYVNFDLKDDEVKEMSAAFFKRVIQILKTEKVDYDPKVVASLVKKFFPDYRRTLNELQNLSNFEKIDETALEQVSGVRNVNELFGFLKDKKFTSMRKWVVDNGSVDSSQVFRTLYDALANKVKPESVPQAILILAKYQYQAAFVADSEINIAACLTELMVDCEYQ